MRRCLLQSSIVVLLAVTLSDGAWAQSPVAAQLEVKKVDFVRQLLAGKQAGKRPQNADLNPGNNVELYFLSLGLSQAQGLAVARDLAKVVEAARVDKQLGSGSSASGSTSVTEKGAVPRVLAFAVENGALTRTESGTTISFKGNPAGIINTLAAGSPLPKGPWARIAFGVEFDAGRGAADDQSAVFIGDRQQLSGFNVKYEFLNHRDPGSSQFQRRAEALYAQAKSVNSSSTRALNQQLLKLETDLVSGLAAHSMEFQAWRTAALSALDTAADEDELTAALNEQLTLLSTQIPFTAEEQVALGQYVETYGKFLDSRDALLELAGKGAVLSIAYVNSRPVDQPTESTLTWLFEWSAINGKMDLTANASTTVLNGTLPDGVDRWKAWAVSGQLDVPLGAIVRGRTLVFTLSGRAEGTIVQPSNERDTIWLGQAKLTFPVKDAGVKLPLSITVASRTDLLDESVVRANVGFTFNFDSLIGN